MRFRELMSAGDHLLDAIEPIAQAIHEDWRSKRGTAAGKEADVPWDELSEHYRASNRMQAMDIVRKLKVLGYRCERAAANAPLVSFAPDQVERLARMEHDRWMQEKMASGWTYGPERNNALKIHDKLVPYDQLSEQDKDMDRDPVRKIPEMLANVGWGVVRC